MAGLNGVLNTDLSGLEAYRAALNAVSENVSNATTPGYGRRTAELATQYQGAQQVSGTGVSVTGIKRIASQFADTRLRAATASQGRSDALVNALTTLQANFPAQGGIAQALSQFFSDAKSLATQPADQPARQTLISDGGQLAASFQQVAGNINDSLNNLSQSATELTQQANQLLQQLAQINQSLRSRGGENINSLLDNQQAALQKLAQLLGANVIRHSNGTIRLSVRGQVLLDAGGARTLTLKQTPGQPPQVQLPNGHTLSPDAASGKLGGTLTAWAQSQAQLQNVNRMATVTAWLINGQQALGLNSSSQQGAALLTMPTPSVVAQPGNTGTETLSAQITDATQLPQNGGPYLLSYNGAQWQATNQASGKQFSVGSGPTLSFKGLQVTVSGAAPSAGDSFVVNPVRGAAAGLAMTTTDPGSIAAAAPYVATAGTIAANGTVTDSNAGSLQVAAGKVTGSPAATALQVPAQVPAGTGSTYSFGDPLQLVFTSPTAYQVQTPAGTVIASGSYSASNGGAVAVAYPSGAAGGQYWQMSVNGQPAAGDTFTLTPGGSQSGENADALGQLNAATVVQGGSLNDAWSYVTGGVGTAVKSAQTSQSNAQASVQSAKSARNSVSGVSLDNQAAQLQLYTQAYQASAKAIATVNQLFQSLLSVV